VRRGTALLVALAVLAAWPCAPILGADNDQSPPSEGEIIPRTWLQEKVTVEEAERQHPGLPNDERVKRFPKIAKPFGFMSDEWEALKARMLPGDELWTFSSPSDSFRHLGGREGIALVRNNKIIVALVTMMN